jgi:hypothetical protein
MNHFPATYEYTPYMKALTSIRIPAQNTCISFFKSFVERIYALGHGKLHASDLAFSLEK